jgi:uncharacterized membrane protein YjdF
VTTATASRVIETGRPTSRGSDRALLLLAGITSAAFVVISLTAKVATYRINFLFLIPIILAPYLLRRRLHLHPAHYAMLAVAFLLHDVGAYGFYQRSPLPFSWDILVHYYFAIPVSLIMHRAIGKGFPQLRPWQVALTTLLFMMGLGALHEIMEFASYLLLGEERGMLKPKTSYFFDTQRDLTNNLLGTLTALVGAWVARALRGRPTIASRTDGG